MDLSKFKISNILRYLMSGFNFMFFVIILPAIFIEPDGFLLSLKEDNVVSGLILLSLLFGYLMDIFKFYNLYPSYSKNKLEFFDKISKSLGIEISESPLYFTLTYQFIKRNLYLDINRIHSGWVVTLNTAITLLVSLLSWIIVLFYYISSFNLNKSILTLFVIVVVVYLAIRLFRIAENLRSKFNDGYIKILTINKEFILNNMLQIKHLSSITQM